MSDVLTERSDAGIERSDDLTERSLASIERPSFDWKTPNYPEVFRERLLKLRRLRERPENFVYLKRYYRDHIADFINDWGTTKDPRNVEIRRAALMPFLLWPKQRAWVEWVVDRWKNRQDGITEKSRDSGVTWLAVAVACSLCMLYDDMAIGFGSRKKEYVDDGSVPKSIFAKIRDYLRGMPPELTGWWTEDDSPSMRCLFPSTRSVISGECGDGIGRGDRTGIYFVDEAAHLEHPDTTDQALSQTTNCRIDISTPFGMANSFAIRRHSGRISVFSFSWRDDPRKDQAWYDKQKGRLDPVSLAQEIDGSYTASVEGLIIPAEWVQSCVDAHVKLGITPSGVRSGALDIADEGKDLNAFAARHGVLLMACSSWSGKTRDVSDTAERAYAYCDELKLEGFTYDADGGYGTGVRSETNRIAERRKLQRRPVLRVTAFRGSGAVFGPDRKVPGTDVVAKERFQNAKAQGWHSLSERARNTHNGVNGMPYDKDNLLSISSGIPELNKMMVELSQPQWKFSASGKLLVDKVPDGAASPNLADAVMMLFAPRRGPLLVTDAVLREMQRGNYQNF